MRMKFVWDGCSKFEFFVGVALKLLDQLFWISAVGVVFFPSLPFVGVMLFPSFRLGNAPGEGDASLALLSLFLVFLLPSFFFSPLLFSSSLLFFSSPAFPSASLFLLSVFLLCSYLFFLFSFLPITLLFFFFNSFHPFSSSPLFHFPLSCLLLILSISFVPLFSFSFFFFEGIACTECLSRCNRGHH